jgi:eukaryotic-like serine/threonine-protein kinase
MPEATPSHPHLAEPLAGRKDPAYQLWQLWQRGERPDVGEFLAGQEGLSLTQCLGVLRVDQQQRWLHGERVTAEDYLQRCFFLHDHAEQALDLVYCEFLLREQLGEAPELDEYAARFPQFAEPLRLQVELHRALGRSLRSRSAGQEGPVFEERLTVPRAAVAPPEAALPAVPGYEVLEPLGRGGMGVVYKARQLGLRRLVALKMLRADDPAAAELLARFRAESAALARLQHPNIVQVFEVGEHQGRPFFSLELVEGGSLDRCLDGAPQPAAPVAQFVQTLARAVQYAHERGIVHRDLKPHNVLLAEDGTPKVTDFGLAKLLVAEPGLSSLHYQTQSGAILGTPSYMAPEQAGDRAGAVGPWTDVWALGAILYELLTGRPPFRGGTVLETLEQVRTQEPVPPSRLQPKVPRDLETVCLKCLRKEPAQRYASAEALADDLQRFGEGRPVLARPLSRRERCWKWAKRRPAAAALALALPTLLAALFALWVWSDVEVRSALGQAEEGRKAAERSAAEARRESKEAHTQGSSARRQYQIARHVINEFCTSVSQEHLLRFREMEGLRTGLLRRAIGFYDRLVLERPDDLHLQAERARAYMRYGQVVAQTQGPARALELYDKGLSLLEKANRPGSADGDLRLEVAMGHRARGDALYDLRRMDASDAAYQKALAIQLGLPKALRGERRYARELASTRHNLGLLHHLRRRYKEAERELRAALAIHEHQAQQSGEKAEDVRRVALTRIELANVFMSSFRPREAEANARVALDLSRKLFKKQPGKDEHRLELGRSLVGMGNFCFLQGRNDEAAAAYREAHDLFAKLAAAHPTIAHYQEGLATSTRGLAMIHGRQGKWQLAEEGFRKAAEIYQHLVRTDPHSPEHVTKLASCWQAGAVMLCRAEADEKAIRWADRAITGLRQALAWGRRDPRARDLLWKTYRVKAECLSQLGRHAEAARSWEEAARASPASQRRWLQFRKAGARAAAGAHVEAAAEVESLLPDKGGSAADAFEAAKAYAACSRAAAADGQLPAEKKARLVERHAVRAVSLLARAHAGKAFADAEVLKHLLIDQSLHPLRERDDFRRLVERIQVEARGEG